jgi:UDP-glucuronate 4-epimerase
MPSNKILVTGGAGFIGSHLCEALLKNGHDIIALDNFDPCYPRELKERNLDNLKGKREFRLIEADIRSANDMERHIAAEKPSAIVHLAARAGVRPSLEQPALYSDVNVTGTVNMFEAAQKSGVKNFVFASSSSVYGNRTDAPFLETDSTDLPLSPYGATKKAGEVTGYAYHHLYGMSVSCLRLFTVYGPRQRPDLAIRKFAQLALTGKEIPVFGDGSSRRDYTHVSDIVGGILGALSWGSHRTPRYGIFNLGSAYPVLLRDLLSMMEEHLGIPLKRKFLPPQPGDVTQTFANTEAAERELGFTHRMNFNDGLRDFLEWMKTQQPA